MKVLQTLEMLDDRLHSAENVKKKNKFIHFIEKWMIIGIILFVIVQLTAITIVNIFAPDSEKINMEEYEEYNKDYLGHWYNGTFFINMTVSENFESPEKYEEMLKEKNNDVRSKICFVGGGITTLATIVLIIIAVYKERKMKLLEGKTPIIIILGGISYLLYRILEEIDLFIDVSYWKKYSTGFLTTSSFYPQMHYIFILPMLLIFLGLVFRQKQRKDLKLPLKNNERAIKVLSIAFLVGGLSFIAYRLGVRLYELLNHSVNMRLPFYYYIFDLPRSFAKEPSSYTKLAILRFIKDLPVFIASIISIILFVKIILTSIKGNLISEDNNKRYKIIFISLIVASLIFNVLGLFEVKLLNNEFLYQYKEAVYTLAIRSLTEPIFYGFFIYVFKHYTELGYTLNKSKK